MTQAALKKKLHKVIDEINDEKLLEAVYTILNNSPHREPFELSDEAFRVIEERHASYKAGKTKMLSPAEVRKKIMKSLKK